MIARPVCFLLVLATAALAENPLNIAHRGSSGMMPEHTVEAYKLAVEQGADIIECDLALTKDVQFICTHDSWLEASTDVASHPEFADRKTIRTIDGVERTDWYTVDFTLEEIKTLRKVQYRDYRDQQYNGMFELATFDEYVEVAKTARNGSLVGIYPELKNPDFFDIWLLDSGETRTMGGLLLESLDKHGYGNNSEPNDCFIQSFDPNALLHLSNKTTLPLIFLTNLELTDQQLETFSGFCYGLGVNKNTIVKVDRKNLISGTSNFVQRIHDHGMKVHAFTFRNENQFLAFDYGQDAYNEYQLLEEQGIDGFFTDFPASMTNYLRYTRNAAGSATQFSTVLLISLIMSYLFTWNR